MKIPHIPHRVVLGPGYEIRVVLVPAKDLAAENDEEDVPRPAQSPGSWDADERLIRIDAACSRREQWRVFRHELLHALHDVIWIEHEGRQPP